MSLFRHNNQSFHYISCYENIDSIRAYSFCLVHVKKDDNVKPNFFSKFPLELEQIIYYYYDNLSTHNNFT